MTIDKQSYIYVGTEGVIRRCKSKMTDNVMTKRKMTIDKQSYIHVGTEGVIRRCKSKENRQCNDLKKNDQRQPIIHTCRY
jgi:hypothetical protein